MANALRKIQSFAENENGQGLVEYALIISLIAIVVIAAITLLGGNLTGIFNKTATELSDIVSA